MITLSLVERDGKGELTGNRLPDKEFATGIGAATWFDKQRGHNIERDLSAMDKGIPPIRFKSAA